MVDKPQIVKNVIIFLNSKTWNELKVLGVRYKTSIVMEAKKLTRKKNLVQLT